MKIPTLVVKFKEQAELDEIKRDAHAHNMNVSEYIRYLVAKERKKKCIRAPKNDEVRE